VLDGTKGPFYFSVSSAAFCSYAGVSVALVALASLERGWIVPIPGLSSVLEYIGSRSYSLYLGHMLIVYLYNDLYFRWYEQVPDVLRLTRTGYALQFVAFLALAIGLAELSYRLVETPFRNAGRQLTRSLIGTFA
jgi:peptidoglycan/LPS O-acetylase OafA/YrhL